MHSPVRTAVEAAEHLARNLWTMPVLASDSLGWQGLIARRYANVQPEHVELPPLEDNVLIFTVRGASRIDGRMSRTFSGEVAAPGSWFLAPHSTPSQWFNSHPVDILHLYVPPTTLAQFIAEGGSYTAERIELRELCSYADPLLEHLASGLLREMVGGQPEGSLYANALIQSISAHLLRHYSNLTPHVQRQLEPRRSCLAPVALRQLCDYVHDNLSKDLSLDHLARIAHMSSFHLTRLFKQATGTSLHQYIIQQRVEQARQLLEGSDLRIADVAVQVGFYDHAHLTRHFTRLIGVSPSSLRKIVRNGRNDMQAREVGRS